jgi:hypothetical protein
VDVTDEDRRVAAVATELLADSGRPDLEVSPEQLIRWRQVAHAIPVSGPRRGGRRQVTRYRPTAAAVAAQLALALDRGPRNLDQAVLSVFAEAAAARSEARPADDGVRAAYLRHLRAADEYARRAWAHRGLPRSEIPRRLRLPFPGSRRADAHLVSDSVLAFLLGEELPAGGYGAELAVQELAGAVDRPAGRAPNDERAEIAELLGSFSLAALRRTIVKADIAELANAIAAVNVTLDYGEAFVAVCGMTQATSAGLPEAIDALMSNMPILAQISTRFPPSQRGTTLAIVGLVSYARLFDPISRRNMRESVAAMTGELPTLRAMVSLGQALPTKWRPAVALGGAAFIAQLPDEERQALLATVQDWMGRHPGAAELLRLDGPPTQRAEHEPEDAALEPQRQRGGGTLGADDGASQAGDA